jgi:hypothetical protein
LGDDRLEDAISQPRADCLDQHRCQSPIVARLGVGLSGRLMAKLEPSDERVIASPRRL